MGGAPAGGAGAGHTRGRWGIEHRPTGAWVAFGSEAGCRTLAAQLTEADAGLRRLAAADAAGGVARHDARR